MENVELLEKNGVDIKSALGLWGDMTAYNDALKEYKNTFPGKLTSLENYINNMDWANYAVLAHSIKSEAKYLGFLKEAEVFYEHELKGKANDGVFIKENFYKVQETATKITNLLNEYFGEKKNLLIADDSNIILSFLEQNIKDEYNVLKASDGKETIAILANNSVHALLLDLNMPGLSGFEVLDYLKERDLLDKIPVVIITGDDNDDSIEKAFSYPILDVLKKPFNESNINSALTNIEHFYHKDA